LFWTNGGRFILVTPGELGDESQEFIFDGETFYVMEEKDFVPITVVEAKTNPRLMAAFGIAVPLRKNHFASLGKTLIDGSDRSIDSVSWRMRVDDADDDSMYVWIEVNRKYGEFETARMLSKIAPNRDCSEEGGVLFKDFEMNHGLAIPKTRLLVSGLFEKVSRRIELVRCEWTDKFDEESFLQFLPEKEEKVAKKAEPAEEAEESEGEQDSEEDDDSEEEKK